MSRESERLSVTVLVHNLDRARHLKACLESIAKQEYRPLEVVLLDAGSTDDSPAVIQGARAALDARGISLRTIQCPRLGVAASRNLAASYARGDLLCFLDNDALFAEASAVALCAAEFQARPRLAAIALRILLGASDGVDPFSWVYRRSVEVWADQPFATFIFAGAGCCIRSCAFREAGGFWDALPYAREEEDLGLELIDLGWSIAYNPAVRVRHFLDPRGRLSLAERRRNELRNGILVLWRRLPLILAVPAIAGRLLTMSIRLLRRQEGRLNVLLRAVPDACRCWRTGRHARVPISFAGAIRYAQLHRSHTASAA